MPQPRIKQILSELPFERKLIGAGALLIGVSLFFSWYSDIDTFHTGQVFSGLSGPLYLVGFTFLLISVLSVVFVLMDYFNRRVSFFNVKSSRMYFGFGIFSFYLLFVENSVYFDHNFGVNLSEKNPGTGMFIAFIGSALLTVGGYMALREKKALLEDFEEETRDVLIATPKTVLPKMEQQKPRESIRTVYPNLPTSVPALHTSENVKHAQLSDAEKQKIRENLRRSAYGDTTREIPVSAGVAQPAQEVAQKPRETHQIPLPPRSSDQAVKAPQSFRMDL